MNKTRQRAALLLLALGSAAGCDAPPPTPPAMPFCPGSEVILADAEQPTGCDMRPPQVLSYFMDDPGPLQEDLCLRKGGLLSYHAVTDREICYDTDY